MNTVKRLFVLLASASMFLACGASQRASCQALPDPLLDVFLQVGPLKPPRGLGKISTGFGLGDRRPAAMKLPQFGKLLFCCIFPLLSGLRC